MIYNDPSTQVVMASMKHSLFGDSDGDEGSEQKQAEKAARLGQYFTPVWVAQALIEEFFPDLDGRDLVLEPSAGPGQFLQAIPAHVPAVGVEIDPEMARQARARTGRTVITGDFRTVKLDLKPTAIIGNPPFDLDIVDSILEKAHRMLPDGGRVGFILPCYAWQTPSRTVRYSEMWSLKPTMLPRTIFPGLSKPLMFALFSKDRQRSMIGMALYREALDVERMPKAYADTLRKGEGSVWARVVSDAVSALGGEAELQHIYAEIAPRRPTATEFWRQQIRKVARQTLVQTGPGRYALPGRQAA